MYNLGLRVMIILGFVYKIWNIPIKTCKAVVTAAPTIFVKHCAVMKARGSEGTDGMV